MDFSIVDLSFLIIFLGLLLYYYGTSTHDYFKKRGIKNITPLVPFFGNTLPVFMGKEVSEMMCSYYKTFQNEKYFGVFAARKPFLWITDLEIIKKVTIKDFDHFVDRNDSISLNDAEPLFKSSLLLLKGQKWKEMRSTLTPAFTSSKMRNMFPFVEECCVQLLQHIEKNIQKADSKEEIAEFDTKDLFTKYTNDVIASNAFGLKIDSFEDEDNEFYRMGTKFTKPTKKTIIKSVILSLCPALMKLFKIKLMQSEITDFFRNLVKDAMKIREEQKIYRPDMIQLLMEAKKRNPTAWNDDELAAQAFVFFLAGFESVSMNLTYACYQLAANPEIQETLRAEIDDILNSKDGLTYEKLMKMPYMDQFISETLRLWAAVALDRKCVKEYELPPSNDESNNKYTIEKDSHVIIPTRCIHRDPKYFPDPEKFDPDRFSEIHIHENNMNAFLPFGNGPRQCIGNRFALMEMKSVFFYILSKYKIITVGKTTNPETAPKTIFTFNPKAGWWVGMVPR